MAAQCLPSGDKRTGVAFGFNVTVLLVKELCCDGESGAESMLETSVKPDKTGKSMMIS